MAFFLLQHRHDARECGVVFTAFRGHASPLRHHRTLSSCVSGGHEIWWKVDADSEASAIELLPPFVAERTAAVRVDEVEIP
jgi:hypothetical protein